MNTNRTIEELHAALKGCWSAETSLKPASWTPTNLSLNQCVPTALVVQDYFGGTLKRGMVGTVSHYWNITAQGIELDLTRDQFPIFNATNITTRERSYLLSNDSNKMRYELLAKKVQVFLNKLTAS